jgi:hypothetical protein
MTSTGMRALRTMSTLAHVLPDIRLRLRHGDRLLAEVGHPGPADPGAARRLSPCQLRQAVAEAWRQRRAGRRVALLGLPLDADPTIEVGVAAHACVLAGGVIRVGQAARWVYAFAASLDLETTRRALAPLAADAPLPAHPAVTPEPCVERIDLHHDEATGVTVVSMEVPPDPCPTRQELLLATSHRLLVACCAAELEEELAELQTPP